MRRGLIAVGLAAALTAPGLVTGAEAASPHSTFIVVLQPGTSDVAGVAAGLARSARGEVGFIYENALQGFSITASDAAAMALERNPNVAFVERDQQVDLAVQETPTGIDRVFATANAAIDIDGIDDLRVDVDVAVIDTGVDFDHPDLNVVGGVNCASGGPFNGGCAAGGDDDHYHGTHVAGTIGALDNGDGVVGVAPGARIHAVKVLNKRGSGYTSWIVAGIDWVAGNPDIDVANMSLGGGGFSQAEYTAIQGAVDAGVAFAVAAGNDSDLASKYSPAAFDNVLTTSALADFDGAPGAAGSPTCRADEDDTLANFSNYGSAVDIAAPGVCILSTYPLERGGSGTISGTSMASPHVAGALALLASANEPMNATDVHGLYSTLITGGNDGWTDDSGDGVREPLLDVRGITPTQISTGGGGGGTANQSPSVSIMSPSDGENFASSSTVDLTASTSDPDGDSVTVSWTANGADVSNPWTPADGTYQVTARADDGQGGTAEASVTITVGVQAASNLSGSSVNNGRTWTARVTYTGAAGTGVTGSWSAGSSAMESCTVPSGASSCVIERSGLRKNVSEITFTATDGTTVRIFKP